jgi:hypothetical protein
MSTTAPAAVDKLLALAQANVPAGVYCYDGHPGTTQMPQMFTIGGTSGPTIDWLSDPIELGARSREEKYEIHCTASAAIGGTWELETQVRLEAWAIVQALEIALKADATLGGTVRYAQLVAGTAYGTDSVTAPQGRMHTIEFVVRCEARVEFP